MRNSGLDSAGSFPADINVDREVASISLNVASILWQGPDVPISTVNDENELTSVLHTVSRSNMSPEHQSTFLR